MALHDKSGGELATFRRRRPPPDRSSLPSPQALGRAGALKRFARSHALSRGVRVLLTTTFAGLLGLLLLLATATVPVLFGYHTYTVNGGSMEPALRSGSVAVTAPTAAQGLKVGDIVAYRASSDAKPVLHRIIDIVDENGERRFVTQGDQNVTPDAEPVALNGPGDRLVYSVPYAGYILNFAASGAGRVVLIAGPIVVLTAISLNDKLRSGRKRPARGGIDGRGKPDGTQEPDDLDQAASVLRPSIPGTWLVRASDQAGPGAALIASVPDGWLVRADLLHELLAS